mmetsp:Transcript_5433/g.11825  ORF Transcript_5433/g.11825 Transcript_5433/m.11825 type:complete len:605 (-) Transcript_5433:157-1971(-)
MPIPMTSTDATPSSTTNAPSASSSSSSRHQRQEGEPRIELILSRPRYRSGGVVVGTVLISAPPGGNSRDIKKLRRSIHTAKLYLSGHTRIDPRWHTTSTLTDLYGSHPHLSSRSLPEGIEQRAVRAVFGDCRDGVHVEGGGIVCFYASNVVDLIGKGCTLVDRPEHIGEYGTMSSDNYACYASPGRDSKAADAEEGGEDKDKDVGERMNTSNTSVQANADGRQRQQNHRQQYLAFTFRSKLPDDAPPSAATASARYFYSAVLCVEMGPYESDPTIVIQTPFEVVHSRANIGMGHNHDTSSSKGVQSGGRVKVGTLHAISHPSGLPCYVSPTDWNQPAKISVDRDFGTCSRTTGTDVRSLRVTDQNGCPCCVLTLVGASVMRPGGRVEIRCDFDEEVILRRGSRSKTYDDNEDAAEEDDSPPRILPCYRVSVLLQGEEIALNEDGTSRRTRSYAFDAKHALVEPGCTDAVSLGARLPLDCPISIHTDLVRVTTTCKIVLTVKKNAQGADATPGGSKYDFLTLEVPCVVQHDAFGNDDEQEDMMQERGTGGNDAADLLGYCWHTEKDGQECKDGSTSWRGDFFADDIMNDLKMLSMYMVHSLQSYK